MAGKKEAESFDGGSIREGGWYWMRVQNWEGSSSRGVVVMAAWMLSKRKYHTPYIRLFNSLGWDCLVCEPHVLNLWFPGRATTLAKRILDELVKELQQRQRPIVFASFSGGGKAFLYKLLQIIQGKSENATLTQKYEMVRACAAGQIFDSSPIDFKSSIGVKFIKSELRGSFVPDAALNLFVGSASAVLELLFHPMFEAQRLDLQETLHASREIGPMLVLCSRKDELAPFDDIVNFCSRIRDLGCEVTLISWEDSDHVGHYRLHPLEYKTAVSKLLANAHALYIKRRSITASSHENALDPSSELGMSNYFTATYGRPRTKSEFHSNHVTESGTFSDKRDVTEEQLHDSLMYQRSPSNSSSQATRTSEQSDEIDDIPCGERGVLEGHTTNKPLTRSRL